MTTQPDRCGSAADDVLSTFDVLAPGLREVYLDLHAHPELSGQEERTAGVVAERLRTAGLDVTARVGGQGVVGVLRNGPGAVVMVRADLDGLPVAEETGLPYASTVRAVDPAGRTVPVMHACGHDMHVTCLLGATLLMAQNRSRWAGTLVVVFQPAEESGTGARAMVADGLVDLVPRPDVVLGQHVAPHPAGLLLHRQGPVLAAADTISVTLHGRGGHASAPELLVDPIVMAAATILRLQTVVAREVPPQQAAVVTVGQVHAGTRGNVLPDDATIVIDVRSFDPETRERVLASIHRVVTAEAEASGAPRPPTIAVLESLPPTVNDPDATARVVAAFGSHPDTAALHEPEASMGSEDFGHFGTAFGAPSVFWFFGGGDPERYARADREGRLAEDVPSNHSPRYAPVIDPTLRTGVAAVVVAAMAWLSAERGPNVADDHDQMEET
jgi:hippurate hydrolase